MPRQAARFLPVSWLDVLLGNASPTDAAQLERELELVLVEGEQIERGFKLFRDAIAFTNRRLVLINKQGITGRKVEYLSIPYKSITHFAVETAGTFDADSELTLWLSGQSSPIKREFAKGANIVGIQRTLAQYVAR
jgi:hypothetical protein